MYTYKNLVGDVARFEDLGLRTGSIGRTVLGFDIPYVFVGSEGKNIIVQGAIHAREHITAELIVKLIDFYRQENLAGGIYFVPMVNIDGVRLVQEGTGFLREDRQEQVLQINGERGSDFTEWKANIEGVDINTNFPARWGTGSQNIRFPAPANFIGEYAASEAETRALMEFTRLVCPCATISYHIRGEEVYWQFFQGRRKARRDKRIAEAIAKETGYKLVGELASAGGYKDWCIQEFGMPAFTIETGKERFPFPFPYTQLPKIFAQNKNVPKIVLDMV